MYANVSTYWWFFRILDIYSIYYFFNFPEAVKNIDKNTYLLYCIQVNSYTSSIGLVFFVNETTVITVQPECVFEMVPKLCTEELQ